MCQFNVFENAVILTLVSVLLYLELTYDILCGLIRSDTFLILIILLIMLLSEKREPHGFIFKVSNGRNEFPKNTESNLHGTLIWKKKLLVIWFATFFSLYFIVKKIDHSYLAQNNNLSVLKIMCDKTSRKCVERIDDGTSFYWVSIMSQSIPLTLRGST